jgi:hypothetical protein
MPTLKQRLCQPPGPLAFNRNRKIANRKSFILDDLTARVLVSGRNAGSPGVVSWEGVASFHLFAQLPRQGSRR